MSGSSDTDLIMHNEFMGFMADETSSAILRGWVERQGWPSATVQMGGAGLFSAMLEKSQPPRLVVIDLDGQGDAAALCARLVDLCGDTTKIIAIGSLNDVGLYRQIISTGVVDYLVKPLNNELLDHAFRLAQEKNKSKTAENSGDGARSSKLIFIIGARGGLGTSSFAANLAWLFANEAKVNTALIDLDLQYGNAALTLDLEPSRGLRDIVSSPTRVDSLMIASAMIAAGTRLSILSAEESVEDPVLMDAGAVQAIIEEMRENFDYVIVEMPRHALSYQRRLMTEASAVLVVTEQSLVGIRDTLRIKMALKSIDPTLPVMVVSARHGKDRAAHVDQATFEKNSQGKIDFIIPEDWRAALEAANAGKPIAQLNANSAPAKAYRTIMEHLYGKKPAAKKSGGWLFGKKSDADKTVKGKKT
ncbi:MAG: AAA family ATPase [Alphaproteobacteria bacterium]